MDNPRSHWMVAPIAIVALTLSGCDSTPGGSEVPSSAAHSEPTATTAIREQTTWIRVNQLGYPSSGPKLAIVAGGTESDRFSLLDGTGSIVMSAALSAPGQWALADEQVRQANFSDWSKPGRFRIQVGDSTSPEFEVSDHPYEPLNRAAIRAFYLTRSGVEISAEHGGTYARPTGHPDTEVRVHSSAAGPERQADDLIASPGGWYDAGDYNKYIVNSGISTYTLLAAYEHNPEYYDQLTLDIPESGNALPDLLDEALWNIRWMLTMQDPADGGVYHKLTTQGFSGMVMPHEADHEPRYVVAKSTAATLDFSATMAVCARIYRYWDSALASECRDASNRAWEWSLANPDLLYAQPDDIQTGTYANPHEDLRDEWAWAATERFILTHAREYLEYLHSNSQGGGVPSWDWVEPLAWISLAHHLGRAPDLEPAIRKAILATADPLVAEYRESAYRMPVGAFTQDSMIGRQEMIFVWGSNGHVANQAIMLLNAHRLTGDPIYRHAALANLDYLLGRNPLDRSFVSGFGGRPPMFLHHRISVADGIPAPIPGMLAGGPNQHRQDVEYCAGQGVSYASELPALSYLDEVCSYASNEMAINWNAALVYVSGALNVVE